MNFRSDGSAAKTADTQKNNNNRRATDAMRFTRILLGKVQTSTPISPGGAGETPEHCGTYSAEDAPSMRFRSYSNREHARPDTHGLPKNKKGQAEAKPLKLLVGRVGIEPTTNKMIDVPDREAQRFNRKLVALCRL